MSALDCRATSLVHFFIFLRQESHYAAWPEPEVATHHELALNLKLLLPQFLPHWQVQICTMPSSVS